MSLDHADRPPFSHVVKVANISHIPLELHLVADQAQREGLAKLWDILSVEQMTADIKIRRWKKDGVRVLGEVRAKVHQACVVSLEPVQEEIFEEFDQIFVPEGSPLARIPANDQGELVVDPDGPDAPETFIGDTLDAGGIVAEFAALALDPYPRKPDAQFSGHIEDSKEADRKPSPFAVLKTMKIKE